MKALAVLRILASLPLLAIAIQHVTGHAPLLPIVLGADLPFPRFTAQVAPWIQIIAGGMLLTGIAARLGAFLAVASMSAAIYSHIVFDWADEPPILLPIAILAVGGLVVLFGGGSLREREKA